MLLTHIILPSSFMLYIFYICLSQSFPIICHVDRSAVFNLLFNKKNYTGHILTGSFVGRGNQYIQLAKVL